MPAPGSLAKVRECKLCGSEDDKSCTRGSFWIAPDVDVCSSCAEDHGLINGEEAKAFLEELDL